MCELRKFAKVRKGERMKSHPALPSALFDPCSERSELAERAEGRIVFLPYRRRGD